MIKHQLEKDIDMFVQQSIISTEQAECMRAYYKNNSKHTLETSMLLPLIGVLLIGAGFIALCAANWEYLNDSVRLIIAFVPLVILNIFLFKYRNTPSEVLIQCLTFGVAFACLFAMGIVANIFQTPVPTDLLVYLMLLCVLPLIYVFDAYWLGILTLAGAISSVSDSYIIISILGLISLTPYCYFRLKDGRSSNLLILGHMIVVFLISILIFDTEFSYVISLAILLIIGLFFNNDLYRRSLKIGLFLIGITSSFIDDNIFYRIDPNEYIQVLVYALLLCFALYYTLKYISVNGSHYDKVFNLQAIAILTLFLLNIVDIPTDFIFTALMLFIFGYNAFTHFKIININGYNKYSFVFTALVLSRMSALNITFTAQGVLFIILGIIFILLSRTVNRLMKIELANQNTEVV